MTQAAVDWERRRYLELFEFAPVGLIVTDPQGKILEINRAATALFGIEPGFLVGRPLFAYLKSASGEGLDWLALQEAARALTAEGAIESWEVQLTIWSARRPVVLLNVVPVLEAGVKVGLQWSLRDVSAEREAEARYATAFANNPAPTFIARLADVALLDANEEFVAALGVTWDEVAGKPLSDLELFAEPAKVQDLLAALPKEAPGRVETEVTLQGERRVALVSARPISLRDEACGIFTLVDITASKRTEEQLVQAIEGVMQDTAWFSRGVVEKLAQVRSGRMRRWWRS